VEYERDVKAVTKPIMQKYSAKLENMKRDLGGKGDAVGASAVQQEIDNVTAALSEKPKSPTGDTAPTITGQQSKDDAVTTLLGSWNVAGGSWRGVFTFEKNGKVTQQTQTVRGIANGAGKWQLKKDRVLITWSDGHMDAFLLPIDQTSTSVDSQNMGPKSLTATKAQ